jgi:hypothetical protein
MKLIREWFTLRIKYCFYANIYKHVNDPKGEVLKRHMCVVCCIREYTVHVVARPVVWVLCKELQNIYTAEGEESDLHQRRVGISDARLKRFFI